MKFSRRRFLQASAALVAIGGSDVAQASTGQDDLMAAIAAALYPKALGDFPAAAEIELGPATTAYIERLAPAARRRFQAALKTIDWASPFFDFHFSRLSARGANASEGYLAWRESRFQWRGATARLVAEPFHLMYSSHPKVRAALGLSA